MNIRKKWPNCIESVLFQLSKEEYGATLEERLMSLRKITTLKLEERKRNGGTQEYEETARLAFLAWDLFGRKTYVFSEEFSHALAEIKDEKFPKELGSFTFEILFHESLGFKSVHGKARTAAIVTVVKEEDAERIYLILSNREGGFSRMHIPYPGRLLEKYEGVNQEDRQLIVFILNCITYIKSASPDLERLERPQMPEHFKRRERDRFMQEHSEKPYFPVHLVSWNWMRPRSYSVDETTVKGHFRWQRCGEGWKDVRLVWIHDHIRKFNNEED